MNTSKLTKSILTVLAIAALGSMIGNTLPDSTRSTTGRHE